MYQHQEILLIKLIRNTLVLKTIIKTKKDLIVEHFEIRLTMIIVVISSNQNEIHNIFDML